MEVQKLTLDPETLQRLTDAFNEAWEALKQAVEIFTSCWEENIKPLFDKLDWTLTVSNPDTPYRPKIKFRLFDKRMRVYHCRNNC